jgi:hypothetical protein
MQYLGGRRLLLYCFIQLSKPGPQIGNDRLGSGSTEVS